MLLSFPLKCVAFILIIVNIVRSIRGFYSTGRTPHFINLDTVISLALAGCFMLVMSPNLLVDAFGMIMGLILQVLQIGDNDLLAEK